jgi:hypothetical protein
MAILKLHHGIFATHHNGKYGIDRLNGSWRHDLRQRRAATQLMVIVTTACT